MADGAAAVLAAAGNNVAVLYDPDPDCENLVLQKIWRMMGLRRVCKAHQSDLILQGAR